MAMRKLRVYTGPEIDQTPRSIVQDTAAADTVTVTLGEVLRKAVDVGSTAADTARSENAQLDRFLKLNQENTRTGPVMGMLPNLSDTAKEMESISADMARHQRQPAALEARDIEQVVHQIGRAHV